MVTQKNCRRCGAPLSGAFASESFCPKCLFREASGRFSSAPTRVAPAQVDWESPTQSRRQPGMADFELLEEIGRGGMGIVYRAWQRSLARVVAIKVIALGARPDGQLVKRFQTEARAAASLQHPNIVAIHQFGCERGHYFLVMDYVDGPNLSQLVRTKPLPPTRAAHYVRTAAAAVHYAHSCGLLHRDLKPSNILIDSQDQPRILDFGLARRWQQDSELTATGQVLGSPQYLPPEATGADPSRLGPHTDVYGLGATLYHILTGRPPHQGDSMAQTLTLVLHVAPLPPHVVNSRVPPDLSAICLKCLEKEPDHRYSTPRLLADDLERFLSNPAPEDGHTGWPGVDLGDRRWHVVAAAALILLTGIGGGSAVWQWHRAEAARERARQAERAVQEKARASAVAQARALRLSGRVGQRFESLAILQQAAAQRPSLELRNEAIASLLLPDVRVQTGIPLEPQTKLVGLAFDPQFSRYARATTDGTVTVCRVRDHVVLHRFKTAPNLERAGLIFSGDGKLLGLGAENPARLNVWELSEGRSVLDLALPIRSFSFNPAESKIAAAERNGVIHIFDLETASESSRISVVAELNHIAYSPTAQYLAVSRSSSPSLLVLETASWAQPISFEGFGDVGLPAWSPEGKILAGPSDDGRVYLWNIGTGAHSVLQRHSAAAKGAVFSRNGDMLASVGWDGLTRFWDVNSGRALLSVPGGWVQNGFSETDEQLGFAVSPTNAGIWQVASGRICHRIADTETLWAAAFVGNALVTASDKGVHAWETSTGTQRAFWPLPQAHSISVAPNGASLVICAQQGLYALSSVDAQAASPQKPTQAELLSPLIQERGCLSPDGHTLISAAPTGADVLVFDLEGKAPPKLLQGHPNAAWITVSPDGQWFASGTWHGAGVKVWSTQSWQPVQELPIQGSATCVFSPDGQWLVTGSAQEYCFWRVGTWERARCLVRHEAGDMSGTMLFSPDGHSLALLDARNERLKLVSFPAGEELASLETGPPLCFSADGAQLATAGEDRRCVYVWDLALLRQQLRSLNLDW